MSPEKPESVKIASSAFRPNARPEFMAVGGYFDTTPGVGVAADQAWPGSSRYTRR
jgi:hypothetical protein